jgi:hypothetical protein
MKTKKPAKKKRSVSKKSDKRRLDEGAAKIRKAEKEAKEGSAGSATWQDPKPENGKGKKAKKVAAPAEPVVIPESTRDIKEILADRVIMLPGSIGLRIADNTPIEESLRVLDWATTMSNHVGFMIGDILAFGAAKWGEKYKAAVNQTGRAYSTLKGYLETARRIPQANRVAALTFSHHREILRIGDDEKIATVLKEVGAQAEKGLAPSTREVREKVKKLKPKKSKKAKSIGADTKRKKKSKPEPPPYEPSADEQDLMDEVETAVGQLDELLKKSIILKTGEQGKVFGIVGKCDNKEKERWLEMFHPFVLFHNNLEGITGY